MGQSTTPPSARERILAAATELFLADSVERTSIADICKRAGVSNGSLFHHFENKDDIAVEVSLALGAEYWEVVLAAVESSDDLQSGVDKAIRAALAYQQRHPDKYRFLLTDETPWMRGALDRARAANAPFRQRAGRWISARVKSGEMAVLQTEVYGALLFGTPHWVGRIAPLGTAPVDMEKVGDDLVRVVQKALSKE
jgi:AcrR family transcriptional regulator